VISSVLQSIGKHLGRFTLESVIEEAKRWVDEGRSCFKMEIEAQGLSPPERQGADVETSLLDRLVLSADG
jgi:hypothetical protein